METVLNNFCAEGLNVLSLFDGMSCGQLALQKAGIKVKQYYAAEIDKYAMQVTQHNFPKTIQLGDVTQIKGEDLPQIDLIIGGSPCQGFSFAGKGLNFEDPRSKLFFEMVRLIKECNPKYFFLENVKMKKEHELVISQYMKVAPIEVNSALVSAQNRVRLYWTNINEQPYGLFGDMMADIPQPKYKGILLKDILETNVPDKYYLSDKMLAYFKNRAANFNQVKVNIREEEGKASCLTSSMASCDISDNFIKVDTNLKPSKNHQAKEITGLDFEKTNTLTTASNKDNLVMQLNPSIESNGCQPYQQNRVYDTDGISPALMAQMSCGTHAILENKTRIRRLTPIECERLQTVPDGYTSCVSDTQRYRMLGNGWTVDVIAHFFMFLKWEEKKLFKTVTEC